MAFLYLPNLRVWFTQAKKTLVTLTDAATVAIDATGGNLEFYLSTSSSRTIGNPGAGYPGQQISVWIKNAGGSAITPTLTTGATNAFRYNGTLTALSSIAAGKTRYFTAKFNSIDARYDVLAESGEF